MVSRKVERKKTKEAETENYEEVERVMEDRDSVPTSLTGFGGATTEAGREVGLLKSALKNLCLIPDIFFIDFKDGSELRTGSALIQIVSLILVNPPYNARSRRCRSNSAHNLFSKSNMEYTVSLVGSLMALETPGHIFCSVLMIFHCHTSLRAASKNRGHMELV